MTFNDGIVGIYELTNINRNGEMPRKGLRLKERFFFGFDVLGLNRIYTALQANQQIEAVINIPGWNTLNAGKDIAVMEDGSQFLIQTVQPQLDEDGLRITKLSLERMTQNYELAE